MTEIIDRPRTVREGEELDAAKLAAYLEELFPDNRGTLAVEQFPSGYSNLTYLIKFGDREMVLRRPPFGSKVKSAHDMGREYRVLSKLSQVYPPAPRPLAYCDDDSVLGAPFYLMERIKGVILRQTQPTGLDFSPNVVRRLCECFIDNLADLHRIDYQAAGLGDLGKPEGYVERQMAGWAKRYQGSQTDDIPEVEKIVGWLSGRIPKESGYALIHNDYKFDNIALDPNDRTRIIGVFDWEMCTLGDPLMDLGCSLAYWAEPTDNESTHVTRCFLTTMPGSMTRRELAERYGTKSGRDVSNMLFYYCFGLFRLGVIIQQIYYRYAQGLTKDPRFAGMNEGVRAVMKAAASAADTGKF